MKKLIFLSLAVLMVVILSNNYEDDYYIIPKEAIRIRIIPNSNNLKDQVLKNKVKENIQKKLEDDLKDSKTIEDSRLIINNNIDDYSNIIDNVLKKVETTQDYSIDYGMHYFPEKIYKGVKYEEGNYESLLITLGNAEGDNWWCVLFPPICLFEEDANNKEDTEYSFYIKEMFKKYLS